VKNPNSTAGKSTILLAPDSAQIINAEDFRTGVIFPNSLGNGASNKPADTCDKDSHIRKPKSGFIG
jgi:hypothetical protein